MERPRQRNCHTPVSLDSFDSSPLSSCYDSLLSESQNSSLSDLSGEGYSSLSSSSGIRSGDETRTHYGAVPVGRSTKQAVHREARGNGSEVAWRKTVFKPAPRPVAGSHRCRKQIPSQRGRPVGTSEDDGTVDTGDLLNELVSSVTRRIVRVGSQRPSSTGSGDDDADANEEDFDNSADVGWLRESPHDVNHDRMDSRPPIMRVPRDDSFNGLPSPTLTSVHTRILPAPQRLKPDPLYTAPSGKRILSQRSGGPPNERHPPLTISASYSTTNGSGSDSGTASARADNRKSGVPSSHLALTTQWLSDNFETCDSRISISREKFFYHYQEFAASTAQKLMNQASFGKLLRSLFHLSTRRLGVRGHSKYHYSGIKVKDDSPLKCIAEEIEVESMDFRFSSVPHQRPSIRPKKPSGDASLKPKPPSLNPAHHLTSHNRLNGAGFHGQFGNFSLATGGWQQLQQPIPLGPLAAANFDPEPFSVRTLNDRPIAGRYLPPLSIAAPLSVAEDSFDIEQVLQSPLPDSVPPMYPPDSVVLPDFASSRAIGKPNAALAEEASGFLGAYQDHCQNMINIFYGSRPGDLPALVHAFWSRVAVAASPLFWQEDVLWDIALADLTVYSTLLNELDKAPLHPSAVGRLAYLVYNLSDWTNSVGQGTIPSCLFEMKNEACRALRDAFNESAATANATAELQCVYNDENRYEELRDRWNQLSFRELRSELSVLQKPAMATSTSKFSLCLEVPKGGRRNVISTSGQKCGRPNTGRQSSASSDATARKRKRSVNKSKHEAYLLTDESNSDRRLNRAINLPSEDELTCLILSHKHDKEEEEAVRRPFAPFLRQPSLRLARKSQNGGDQRPTAPVPCSEDSTNLDGYAAGTDTDAETETDGENEKVKSAAVALSEHEKAKMNEQILDSVETFGQLIARKAAISEWFEMLDELLRECIPLSPSLLHSDYLHRAGHVLRRMSFVLQQIVRLQGEVSESEIRPLHVLVTFLENGTIDRIRRRLFCTKVHWYEEQTNGEIARIINPSLSVALDRIGFFTTVTNAASLAQSATKTTLEDNETTQDTPTGLRLSVITGERDPLLSAGTSFPSGIAHYANGMLPPSAQYNQISPGTASSYASDGCELAVDCESYLDSVMKDAEARSPMTLDGHGRLLMQRDEMDEAFRYAGVSQMHETNELEAMTITEGPKFTFSQYSPRHKDIFGMVPDRSSLSKIILPFRMSTA